MTLDEKIAQLIMIQVYSDGNTRNTKSVVETIRKYKPGGICFFNGGPVRQVALLNRLQKVSDIPLLIAIDGEWGPAMRLDSCLYFPRQMQLGALPVSSYPLIYQMGQAIGRQCRALGIHLNFAPCVDVNCNPSNPVINSRSFGENPDRVAAMAVEFMKGMQSENVSACAKHFPGHGDTHVDSHLDLPVIHKSRAELEKTELLPFRRMVAEGTQMVMVGHLRVPALDSAANSITSLSQKVVTDLLRGEMHYQGLVITDALGMKGVRNQYSHNGEAEILALLAGVDILLMPSDLGVVIPAIRNAVKQGRIPESLIDERCQRILEYKESKGLTHFIPLPTSNLIQQLNTDADNALVDSIEAQSITLLRNDDLVLPILPEDTPRTLLLCVGASDTAYYHQLAESRHISFLSVKNDVAPRHYNEYAEMLAPFTNIVVMMAGMTQNAKSHYGVTEEAIHFLNHVLEGKRVVLALMGNPYALSYFNQLSSYNSVVVGYSSTKSAAASALRCIFGERDFTGILPVTVCDFAVSTSLQLPRPTLADPDEHPLYQNFSALSDRTTYRIDSMVTRCIQDKILPGCQILAMKSGNLLFYKNYGKLTYEGEQPVTTETAYDVASMTKALSTTLALMKLYDEGKIGLHDKLKKYLSFTRNSPVGEFSLSELLTHTTGLPAGILFYKRLMNGKQWDSHWVRTQRDDTYSVEIAAGMYLHKDFADEALQMIADCKADKKRYIYSDLNFILLKEVVEQVSGQTLDTYVMEHFYRPMGLKRTGYKPLDFIHDGNLAPTEDDHYFRYQVLQGYVHDPSAAVFGGVSGNAGLFSTAQEVSVILTMLMNGGILEGHRYFSKETVEKFVTVCPMHGCERRGLGFDMPSGGKPSSIIPAKASKRTFGHQGFTGTVFWCDPDNGLVYVFLSNRVHPKAEPNRLSQSKLRLLVHDEIYQNINP